MARQPASPAVAAKPRHQPQSQTGGLASQAKTTSSATTASHTPLVLPHPSAPCAAPPPRATPPLPLRPSASSALCAACAPCAALPHRAALPTAAAAQVQLVSKQLVPNYALRSAIESWRAARERESSGHGGAGGAGEAAPPSPAHEAGLPPLPPAPPSAEAPSPQSQGLRPPAWAASLLGWGGGAPPQAQPHVAQAEQQQAATPPEAAQAEPSLTQRLCELGFGHAEAQAALERHDGDLTAAADELMAGAAGAGSGGGEAGAPVVAIAQPSTGPLLPAGWEVRTSPDGKAYYVDHNTRTTHWDPPPRPPVAAATPVLARPAAGGGGGGAGAGGGGGGPLAQLCELGFSREQAEAALARAGGDLTVAAESLFASGGGNSTSHGSGAAAPVAVAAAVPAGAALPRGWEVRTSPDGKTYYVDHNTRTTHWTPPR